MGGRNCDRVLRGLDSYFLSKLYLFFAYLNHVFLGCWMADCDQVKMPKIREECVEKKKRRGCGMEVEGVRYFGSSYPFFLIQSKVGC